MESIGKRKRESGKDNEEKHKNYKELETTNQEKERGEIVICLESDYSNQQKQNELKLFENLKTDISAIISEQLKKKSKAEFQFRTNEKKFNYLKSLYEKVEEILKKENKELIKDRELINNYFEYTTTNLDYVFIKYESIINDFSKSNNDMKAKIKNIKENELVIFEATYEAVKEKTELLKKIKDNIIHIRDSILQLENEQDIAKKKVLIKNEEKGIIEKDYEELVKKNDEYMKEFEKIKGKCIVQMEEKKKTSTDLNSIEEKIKETNVIIQNLRNEKNNATEELNDLISENKDILNKILSENKEHSNRLDLLQNEINILEKENLDLIKKRENISDYYEKLESKFKSFTDLCEMKKKDDEAITAIVKERSKNLIEEKNILKEKENVYSDTLNQVNFIQKENEALHKICSKLESQLIKINEEIANIKEQVEHHKKDLINFKKMEEKNEQTKTEIINLIKQSEKILYEEKSSFFKISKFFNLINLSNEEYTRIESEINEEEQIDVCTKNYDELNESFRQINEEVIEKKNICKNMEKELNIYKDNIQKIEEEIDTLSKENKEIEKTIKTVENEKIEGRKEMKEKEKNSEKQIEGTEQMLKRKLECMQKELTDEFKSKKIEHNNCLKQAEKEKLECEFNLFKTDVLSNFEKIKEEKQKQLVQREEELKLYQQAYAQLKHV